jgi:hypothetical protein
MTEGGLPTYRDLLRRKKQREARQAGGEKPANDQVEEAQVLEPCCQGKVHIAYRGVSDERLYISYDRSFAEVKYFRPYGLRIFCATCRRRMV